MGKLSEDRSTKLDVDKGGMLYLDREPCCFVELTALERSWNIQASPGQFLALA